MPLQSSGPISMSDIASELGVASNTSLRSMSASAGLSTPDSMSEFYGYANVEENLISESGYASSGSACSFAETFVGCYTNFPPNSCPLGSAGNYVYTDSGATTPLTGGNNWYILQEAGCAVQIDNNGLIIDSTSC